jgi:hypothetical protein
MLSSLPEIILVYFHSANTSQTEAACLFRVRCDRDDEGRDHAGTTAIREWIEDTKRKYEPKVEPIRVQESGEKTIVTSSVSGNFPGWIRVSFSGKRIPVTGGTKGAGEAIVRRLAAGGAGRHHLTFRPPGRTHYGRFRASGPQHPEGVSNVAETVLRELRGVDILVHNVGGSNTPEAALPL